MEKRIKKHFNKHFIAYLVGGIYFSIIAGFVFLVGIMIWSQKMQIEQEIIEKGFQLAVSGRDNQYSGVQISAEKTYDFGENKITKNLYVGDIIFKAITNNEMVGYEEWECLRPEGKDWALEKIKQFIKKYELSFKMTQKIDRFTNKKTVWRNGFLFVFLRLVC